MRQNAQKPGQKFCSRKTTKKRKTHPEKAKKGETGCVSGAGGENSGRNRLRTDAGGQQRMQHKAGFSRPCPTRHRHEKAPGHAVFERPGDKWIGRGRRTWSPLRSGRLVACVPLARTRPSTRGFGVDVGERGRERGRASVTRFSRTSPKRVVLVWCSHQILQPFDFHLGLG